MAGLWRKHTLAFHSLFRLWAGGCLSSHTLCIRQFFDLSGRPTRIQDRSSSAIRPALRATDQSPSPETTTTSRLHISKAIFHVVVCHFTAVAECAGRKIKVLEPLSKVAICAVIPYAGQVALVSIANKIFPGCALPIIQKMRMCIQ